MFGDNTVFNQDLSNWQTTNLEDADYMFYNADSFNSNIAGWNVEKLTKAFSMFSIADAFSQNLCSWRFKLPINADTTCMFCGATRCPDDSDPDPIILGPYCYPCDIPMMAMDAQIFDLSPSISPSVASKEPSQPSMSNQTTESPSMIATENPSQPSTKTPSVIPSVNPSQAASSKPSALTSSPEPTLEPSQGPKPLLTSDPTFMAPVETPSPSQGASP
jgi:hypothetical protein